MLAGCKTIGNVLFKHWIKTGSLQGGRFFCARLAIQSESFLYDLVNDNKNSSARSARMARTARLHRQTGGFAGVLPRAAIWHMDPPCEKSGLWRSRRADRPPRFRAILFRPGPQSSLFHLFRCPEMTRARRRAAFSLARDKGERLGVFEAPFMSANWSPPPGGGQ